MNSKVCLIYNYAQHYRANIFALMDRELSIDFVFGDKYLDVKKMDYGLLNNFKKEVRNIKLFKNPIYYQQNVLPLLKENYSIYLMLGELHCMSTLGMILLSKIYGKKIYLWTHGWYGNENRIKKFLKKKFFSMTDGIFLYGNYAKNLMLKEGISEEKLHVVFNSLNYDYQYELRMKLTSSEVYTNKFKNTLPKLIFVGRLIASKRLELLLYALHKLKNEHKLFNLTLIGDGEKMKDLKILASELDLLDSVWFTGAIYDETLLSSLIYNADLCVSPGNVGLTAIHSMSYGTPVISHDNFANQGPEFEAILDGVTGSYFQDGDFTSLSNSISNWFSGYHDREITRKYCYEIVDNKYNPHVQIETFKTYMLE
jgi:glycosyltransferase involved in cell wall biosynthesis